MNIYEATKAAAKCNGGIFRESEPNLDIIVPTNTDACCIICDLTSDRAGIRWNPNLADLLAEDWKPTGNALSR